MTKYERASLFCSALALLVSISTPILTYLWFGPEITAYRHRPRLVVSLSRFSETHFSNEILRDMDLSICEEELDVLNSGDVPSKNLQIVLSKGTEDFPQVELNPPSETEEKIVGGLKYLTVKKPLPPGDTILVRMSGVMPYSVWFYSEYGETVYVDTQPWYDKRGTS